MSPGTGLAPPELSPWRCGGSRSQVPGSCRKPETDGMAGEPLGERKATYTSSSGSLPPSSGFKSSDSLLYLEISLALSLRHASQVLSDRLFTTPWTQ